MRSEFEASNAGLLETSPGLAWALIIFAILFVVLMIASMWKIFTKAGQPGWAAIVPIYNWIVQIQVARKPMWVLALLFGAIVPVIGGLISLAGNIMISLGLAKEFGKSTGFAIGIVFLPFVFLPILAFGDAEYQTEEGVGGNEDLLDN